MKQINGTITLSFLEEDNQQRVIFRVVPLCTREGVVFRDKTVDFPDQGSLRIVPDKREQSTFKERMRAMGNLCAIHLCSEGKELAKVRQNRNYDPGQGESNQFAIYSDVICEFTEDGIFEVFADGADTADSMCSRVLIRRGQVLYGPTDPSVTLDWETIKPFGNDMYLLHTVAMQDGVERSFYWNPEMTLNWRMRRGTLRRTKNRGDDGIENTDGVSESIAAVTIESDSVANVRETCPETMRPETIKQETPKVDILQKQPIIQALQMPVAVVEPIHGTRQAAVLVEEPIARVETRQKLMRIERMNTTNTDIPLPIGKRLSILDDTITFEEQISKLDQPLSNAANFLANDIMQSRGAESLTTARFNGTPLMHMNTPTTQPIRRGEPLHYVVEKQIHAVRYANGEKNGDYQPIENPIENLNIALAKAWEQPETRQQAIHALCANEGFMQLFLRHMQMQGREFKAIRAAQEQLEDIEAERLSLLMQLEIAKNDAKRAMEIMHADLSQKKREELSQLDRQVATYKADKENLTKTITALSEEANQRTLDWLIENHVQLCACNGDTIALTPVVGVLRTPAEMIAAIRVAMNRQGFACNEDDATELLLHFALNDEICLCGDTLPEAELCAHTLLDGLGLTGVTARTDSNTLLEVASVLPQNGLRTPTVEVCAFGRASLTPYGHKTIRVIEANEMAQPPLPLPVVYTPVFNPDMRDTRMRESARPTSLESFHALRADAKPLLEQGEAWFSGLEMKLAEQSTALSGVAQQQMRLFVSAASPRLRGGFIAAADAAVLGWVIPEVFKRGLNAELFIREIEALPRCLAALGVI